MSRARPFLALFACLGCSEEPVGFSGANDRLMSVTLPALAFLVEAEEKRALLSAREEQELWLLDLEAREARRIAEIDSLRLTYGRQAGFLGDGIFFWDSGEPKLMRGGTDLLQLPSEGQAPVAARLFETGLLALYPSGRAWFFTQEGPPEKVGDDAVRFLEFEASAGDHALLFTEPAGRLERSAMLFHAPTRRLVEMGPVRFQDGLGPFGWLDEQRFASFRGLGFFADLTGGREVEGVNGNADIVCFAGDGFLGRTPWDAGEYRIEDREGSWIPVAVGDTCIFRSNAEPRALILGPEGPLDAIDDDARVRVRSNRFAQTNSLAIGDTFFTPAGRVDLRRFELTEPWWYEEDDERSYLRSPDRRFWLDPEAGWTAIDPLPETCRWSRPAEDLEVCVRAGFGGPVEVLDRFTASSIRRIETGRLQDVIPMGRIQLYDRAIAAGGHLYIFEQQDLGDPVRLSIFPL